MADELWIYKRIVGAWDAESDTKQNTPLAAIKRDEWRTQRAATGTLGKWLRYGIARPQLKNQTRL